MPSAAEHSRRYRLRHPDRAAAADRRWQAANRDKVRANWNRQARKRLLTRHGVSAEWFRDQLVGQAGRCAICCRVFQSQKETHIDHDHATQQVRGLICHTCNVMLGLAKDSPWVLSQAIRYLGDICQPIEKRP